MFNSSSVPMSEAYRDSTGRPSAFCRLGDNSRIFAFRTGVERLLGPIFGLCVPYWYSAGLLAVQLVLGGAAYVAEFTAVGKVVSISACRCADHYCPCCNRRVDASGVRIVVTVMCISSYKLKPGLRSAIVLIERRIRVFNDVERSRATE